MPLFFVIKKLDNEYCWQDFKISDIAYDYAQDIHDIPLEYIEDIAVSVNSKRVEITLFEDREIINEDWYQLLLQYAKI